MNAAPLIESIAAALQKSKLEAILIGNAAAALHGAPVTTLDFDFCYRQTDLNETKLVDFAEVLGATLSRPHEPVSRLIRVEDPARGLQVDFLDDLSINLQFASVRSRATEVSFGGRVLIVASLDDIIEGKKKANRPKDQAVLHVIESTRDEIESRRTDQRE